MTETKKDKALPLEIWDDVGGEFTGYLAEAFSALTETKPRKTATLTATAFKELLDASTSRSIGMPASGAMGYRPNPWAAIEESEREKVRATYVNPLESTSTLKKNEKELKGKNETLREENRLLRVNNLKLFQENMALKEALLVISTTQKGETNE